MSQVAATGPSNIQRNEDALSHLVSIGASPEMIVMATEILFENEVSDGIFAKIANKRKQRKMYADRIAQMNDIKVHCFTDGKFDHKKADAYFANHPEITGSIDGGDVLLEGQKSKNQFEFCKTTENPNYAKYNSAISEVLFSSVTYETDPKTGKIVQSNTPGDTKKAADIRTEDVDSTIAKLEGKIKDIDAARELDSISLQASISRKQRLVTLTTNLLQSQHQSESGVIRNVRA